ncbi:MAG: GerW family sporulation protein, partial [Candidatus Riflebacteria bacterium]|nr:GerW family sporulation protein [Candidatus Riflebacteria bacterium]
ATLEPVAFLVVSDKEVKLISLKERETVWEKILSPEVGEKVYNKIMGIAKDTGTREESVKATADEADSSEKKSE